MPHDAQPDFGDSLIARAEAAYLGLALGDALGATVVGTATTAAGADIKLYLVAYIVAIPANEIVVPTILMLTVLLAGAGAAAAAASAAVLA